MILFLQMKVRVRKMKSKARLVTQLAGGRGLELRSVYCRDNLCAFLAFGHHPSIALFGALPSFHVQPPQDMIWRCALLELCYLYHFGGIIIGRDSGDI
jgi:hypothetical protein